MFWLIAFSLALTIQSYFYLFLFRKLGAYKGADHPVQSPAVSVVICARNEADHLQKLIPLLLGQRYPLFEIVLVDDGSTDRTSQLLKKFGSPQAENQPRLVVVSITEKESSGKKHALTRGIGKARYDHLLLTDADCLPNSEDWINGMMDCFSKKSEIVLGYGAYRKTQGSVLNKLIRFETLLTALQYFSYALAGKAYMGVGRNLAYRKDTFLNARGFTGHQHVKSGDDDLFVSQVASANNVSICLNSKAFTTSEPSADLRSWIRQKRRHITTAVHYKLTTRLSLGLFYLSQLTFFVLGLSLLLLGEYLHILAVLVLSRYIFWYSSVIPAARRLNEKDLIAFGPLYEISVIFIQLYIFLRNIISPPKHW